MSGTRKAPPGSTPTPTVLDGATVAGGAAADRPGPEPRSSTASHPAARGRKIKPGRRLEADSAPGRFVLATRGLGEGMDGGALAPPPVPVSYAAAYTGLGDRNLSVKSSNFGHGIHVLANIAGAGGPHCPT